MTNKQKKEILDALEEGCWRIEHALLLARHYGWKNADGFISGECSGVHVCILKDGEVEDHERASSEMITAEIDNFGCGAW